MIDGSITGALNEYADSASEVMGTETPGAQAKFHSGISSKLNAISVPDPLSVAAPTDRYFMVKQPDGSITYTRAGNFHIQDGKILAGTGGVLMGYPTGKKTLSVLSVPGKTPDGWINIAADGTISVADPKILDALDTGIPPHEISPPKSASAAAVLPTDTGHDLQQRTHRRTQSNLHIGADTVEPETSSGTPSSSKEIVDAYHAVGHHILAGEVKGSQAPAVGKAIGRIALAVFAEGTTVDTAGIATSGKPMRIDLPGSKRSSLLRTNSRDLGNVDLMNSVGDLSNAGTRLSALMAAEQSRASRTKTAMSLIK